jgi:lysozyme
MERFATRGLQIAAAALFLAACGVEQPGPEWIDQAATCPGPSTVEGIDVSIYQGNINWASVKADGREFAIARISDGMSLDKNFPTNWPGIKNAQMIRGAYQFFEPADDPAAQAKIVVDAVGMLGDGDLPVTADMEVTGGQSAATIVKNLQTWMAAVQAGTGKTPLIYTSPGFWNGSVNSNAFAGNPLWVANWGVNCPTLPNAWNAFSFWQYADNGTVKGINGAVDLDKFNGTLAELQAFAGATPKYAAKYVSQSWPLATMSFPMAPGEVVHANIVMRNVGTATWDVNTRLATTQPRDRPSPFAAGNWPAVNRLAEVTKPVAPGDTYEFDFDFQAPMQPGSYDEFYGLVEEGDVWFSDPGQGGPPDNDIEAKIVVVADGGAGDAAVAPKDGAASDGARQVDAGARSDGGNAIDAATAGGSGGGCGCTIGARSPASSLVTLALLGLGALVTALARRRGAR